MIEEYKGNKNGCPAPNGVLFMIGGAEDRGEKPDNDKEPAGISIRMEVLQAFVSLLKGKKLHIEVITSAGSKDPQATFKEYEKAFRELGVHTVNQLHHDLREQVDLERVKERLKAAQAVFLAGGDQLKLTSVYGGTELLLFLKYRYIYEKLVIAGTSAGGMALSTPMIYQGVGRDEMINGNVKVTTGLEFLRDVCIDTHFVDRGRFVRMAQVIATNPTSIGIGVEEDTAMIVRNGTEAEVVGAGVIIIINGQKSFGTNITHSEDELLTIRGLEVDILSKGERFQIPALNPPHK